MRTIAWFQLATVAKSQNIRPLIPDIRPTKKIKTFLGNRGKRSILKDRNFLMENARS